MEKFTLTWLWGPCILSSQVGWTEHPHHLPVSPVSLYQIYSLYMITFTHNEKPFIMLICTYVWNKVQHELFCFTTYNPRSQEATLRTWILSQYWWCEESLPIHYPDTLQVPWTIQGFKWLIIGLVTQTLSDLWLWTLNCQCQSLISLDTMWSALWYITCLWDSQLDLSISDINSYIDG